MKPETPSARSSRRSASLQSLLNLGLAAVILVLVNFLAFKHYHRQDLSESQYYTLSAKTKDVLAKLDGPIKIYTFLNEQAAGQVQQIQNLLEEYQAAGGKNVTIEKIDPAYDMKRAADLQKELHFDGNDHLVILQYKDHTPRFVKQDDFFDVNPMTGEVGAFKGEQQLTGAIIALVEGKAAKVYFTEGHGEHSIHDTTTATGYGAAAALLKEDNVETTTLILAQKGEVPADAGAVVIAGPAIPLSPVDVEALDRYLANNGKLMVLVDPYVSLGPLAALLQKYGLKFEDDQVLMRGMTMTGAVETAPQATILAGGFAAQPITEKFAQSNLQLIILDARSITLPTPAPGAPPSKASFLLQTDPDAWGWFSKPGENANPATLTFNKVTDLPGPLIIAAQYDGGATTDPLTKATMPATRLVAVGASQFLENGTIDQVGANFFTNAIDWLTKKNAVLDIAPKKPTQYGLELSPMSYNALAWTALAVVPGVALLLGIGTWFSRRK